jgi:hypothetical protein
MVWVISPFLEVLVYHPNQAAVRLTGDDIRSGEDVLPGFAVPVRELWPGASEEFADDEGDGQDDG